MAAQAAVLLASQKSERQWLLHSIRCTPPSTLHRADNNRLPHFG
uniref:Uncharacterized protein n=1 Tax=Dromaius novaehollandiae TaxID=8790 RepID=A0A8C4JG68_DRONO